MFILTVLHGDKIVLFQFKTSTEAVDAGNATKLPYTVRKRVRKHNTTPFK